MQWTDALTFACVLAGQRVMLTHPTISNLLWLVANLMLGASAAMGEKWILVSMYAILSASNVQLIWTATSATRKHARTVSPRETIHHGECRCGQSCRNR